jgi:lauroyl/myristoyl acyltransferase
MKLRPKRREKFARMLQAFLPEGTDSREVDRQIILARTVRRIGAHTYAPVWRRSRDWLLEHFRPEGLEEIDRIKREGCGAIVLGTHAGLNAWIAPILRQLGYPVRFMQRQNIGADTFLLVKWEGVASQGLPFPEDGEGGLHFKSLHALLKSGVWIQHVADYADPDPETGLDGTYVGLKVRCGRASWALARLTGAAVIPALVLMDRRVRFRMVFGPPITVSADGDPKEAMTTAMQTYLDFVTREVMKMPWNLSLRHPHALVPPQ